MAVSQNEATRIVQVIDRRISRAIGQGSIAVVTYGKVASINATTGDVSVYLASDPTNASQGFKVARGVMPQVGDTVRVVINRGAGRWVDDVLKTTPFPKVAIDPARGNVQFGAGTSAPATFLFRSGANTLASGVKFDPQSLNLPTKAGAPTDADITGTPTDGDIVIDTTNLRLYVRIGGAWKSVVLA